MVRSVGTGGRASRQPRSPVLGARSPRESVAKPLVSLMPWKAEKHSIHPTCCQDRRESPCDGCRSKAQWGQLIAAMFLSLICSRTSPSSPKCPFSPLGGPFSDRCVLLQRIQDLLVLLLGGECQPRVVSLFWDVPGVNSLRCLTASGASHGSLVATADSGIRNKYCSGYKF